MATLKALEKSIEKLLNHPQGPKNVQLGQKVREKAYEAYVYGLCLRAVRELGVTPDLHGISSRPTPFIFRGSPGKIYSTHRNYGFASFTINGYSFELHAGVEFDGTSGMTHELDVSLIKQEKAIESRQRKENPKSSSVIGAWECKFYGGALDKSEARAFVGLLDDFGSTVRLSGLCSNSTHSQMPMYFEPQRRPYPHLVLSPSHKKAETRFVSMLSAELKKMTKL